MSLNCRVSVTIHLHSHGDASDVAKLQKTFEELMSKISDKIATLGKSVDSAIGRVQEDVAGLRAKIDDLQKKIDEGGASDADVAALDSLQAKLDALDPEKSDTLADASTEPNPPTSTPPSADSEA